MRSEDTSEAALAGLRELVKRARKQVGWSQEQLAILTGVSAATIASFEQGRRGPSEEVVAQLAGAFGATVDELWTLARGWQSEPDNRRDLVRRLTRNAPTEIATSELRIARSSLAPLLASSGSTVEAEPLLLTALLRHEPTAVADRLRRWFDEVARQLLTMEELPRTELLSWALDVATGRNLRDLSAKQRERLLERLARFSGDDDLSSGGPRVATMRVGHVHHVFTTSIAIDEDGVLWIDPLARALPSGYDAEDPRVERWDTGQVILDTSRLSETPSWRARDAERHVLRLTPRTERFDIPGELTDAYLTTVIEVERDGGNVTVSPSDPESGDRLPPDAQHIHVITAFNPRSRLLSETENDERNRLLRSDLQREGWAFHDAVGRAPDGSWQEPSFAVVDAPEEQVLELAVRYEQNAVYFWDRSGVRILWT